MAETDTLWQAVDEMRNRQSQIESRVAAHDARLLAFLDEFRESRRERQKQIEDIVKAMAEFRTTLDEVKLKVSEAHGMAKFGKWAAGIAIGILGLFISAKVGGQ